MVIITHNLGLRFDGESYNDSIRLYDRHTKKYCVICNWAVCGCAEDDCLAYAQGNGRPYMDGANHKVARLATNQLLDGPGCAGDHVFCSCSGGAKK